MDNGERRWEVCLRCGGQVFNGFYDDPFCVQCGWRKIEVSDSIRAEVRKFMGRERIGMGRGRDSDQFVASG